MPEAAMHEDCNPVTGQHNVRPARQILSVQAVSEACGKQCPTNRHLGLGIPVGHASHVSTALIR
jgi:hypothetical protein